MADSGAGARWAGFGATNWPSNPKTPVEDAPHCGVFRPAEMVGHDVDYFAQAEIRQAGKDFRGGGSQRGRTCRGLGHYKSSRHQIGYC
jgi:hypothetical protein